MWEVFKSEGKKFMKDAVQWNAEKVARKNNFAVDSRDNTLHYLYTQVMLNATEENHKALQKEIDHRLKVDKFFADAFPHHLEAVKKGTTPLPTDFECYRLLIQTYEKECEAIDDYTLKYMKAFVAECEGLKSAPAAVDGTVHRIKKMCKK